MDGWRLLLHLQNSPNCTATCRRLRRYHLKLLKQRGTTCFCHKPFIKSSVHNKRTKTNVGQGCAPLARHDPCSLSTGLRSTVRSAMSPTSRRPSRRPSPPPTSRGRPTARPTSDAFYPHFFSPATSSRQGKRSTMKWLDKTNRQLSSIFGEKEHWWSNSYSPWDSSSKQRSLEECLWQPVEC